MADVRLSGSTDDFPAFPESCNSLLKKHLTPPIWRALKDRRTSTGVSLQDCIRSGVEVMDSAVGVYAGDAESYAVFAALFDPIIADWHPGFPATGVQRHRLEAACFQPQNPDPDCKYIVSTRVRVARNLHGYRLRPASTGEEDLDVEHRAKAAFKNFFGDLAGSYRPIAASHNSADRRIGVDDQVFVAGDRFQEAAGLNRNWPAGRGVFCNDARSFFVWVNEEDQLRLISLQRDADIAAVFARLCRAMEIIDQSLEFQYSDRYGYVSSCPTNLGTGLRASFHIKLPLSGASAAFHEIRARHHLAVRGDLGEGSAVVKNLYDVSNKRRLGLSEGECLQSSLDGIRELIDLEKSFEAKRT